MRIEEIESSAEQLRRMAEESSPLSAESLRNLRAAADMLVTLVDMIAERDKLIRELEAQLSAYRSSEKSRKVLGVAGEAVDESVSAGRRGVRKKGHGRNGADSYWGADRAPVPHPTLKARDRCPECLKGKLYPLKEHKTLMRLIGQPPVKATRYELESLRCNLCGQLFSPEPPAGAGNEKYDATVIGIVAVLKYGSGVPLNRLQRLQSQFGIPLPAATAWDLLAAAAVTLTPVWNELMRQAAQGRVIHNDDTSMRILCFLREASDARTGLFTSGIVSMSGSHRIALFFTGRKHAGENLAELLLKREAEIGPPIQMCDALSRNTPKPLPVILANCLAHGRRHFVDVAQNFPDQCRYVLETLGEVFHNDALAKKQDLTPDDRLRLHQQRSGPLMERLADWCHQQIDERIVEPNSGLGKAISYMLRHWQALTLFLREPHAPIDNNVCERALKKAILNRKNAMFYRTQNGARVGDLFMSLIHTAELCGANPFDYLTHLQRHADEVARAPAEWLPWNYRTALGQSAAA